jgi:tetratricopeptide (TPR) repeat protein
MPLNSWKRTSTNSFFHRLVALGLAAGIPACSNGPSLPASGAQNSPLAEIQKLIHLRQHHIALTRLHELGAQQVADGEAYFLMGEANFHLGDYRQAVDSYLKALQLTPGHLDAQHRSWAAMIQGASNRNQEKSRVRQSIQQLERLYPEDPARLLNAYYGYGYLWERTEQQRLIRKIAQIASSPEVYRRTGQALVSEILQSPDPVLRADLAKQYLNRFRNTADDRIAAAAVFHAARRQPDVSVLQWVTQYSRNDETDFWIRLYGARTLIHSNIRLPEATRLLNENIRQLDQYSRRGGMEKQRTLILSLLGEAYWRRGRLVDAENSLALALQEQPAGAHAAFILGQVREQQGKSDDAIHYYRLSLETSGRYQRAQQNLARLLPLKATGTGNPERYFAKQEGVTTFTDVTTEAGLAGVPGQRVAWVDYDKDGDDDISIDGSRLFKNAGNGRFVEVTKNSLPRANHRPNGGVWADYDNDGWQDIFVTTRGKNRLLRNDGNGRFIDVTARLLPGSPAVDSQAAAWGHANRDHYPDLYVANYQLPAVERAICASDHFWINEKDNAFVDGRSRLENYTKEPMCGRGVTWGDFDNDGRQEILVANYRLDPNFLWQQRNGDLINRAREVRVAGHEVYGAYGNSIGPVFADFDNDGRIDSFVANLAHPRHLDFSDESQLLINRDNVFRDLARNRGIRFEETDSDPAVADIDNDGDLDLFVTAIYPSGESHLYLNDGSGRFRDISWLSGTRLRNTWGGAFSDFNNDGQTDLLVASKDGVRLLKNDGNSNHWIKLRLRQRGCDRFALGARITVRNDHLTQIREITAGRGTGNQDSLDQVIGFGSISTPLSVEIRNQCDQKFRVQTHQLNRILIIDR